MDITRCLLLSILLTPISAHAMQEIVNTITYYCTPTSWVLQKNIDKAIAYVKISLANSRIDIFKQNGIYKGNTWEVEGEKKLNGDISITVTCSDLSYCQNISR